MPTTLTGRGCWLRRDKRGQIFKHSRPRQKVWCSISLMLEILYKLLEIKENMEVCTKPHIQTNKLQMHKHSHTDSLGRWVPRHRNRCRLSLRDFSTCAWLRENTFLCSKYTKTVLIGKKVWQSIKSTITICRVAHDCHIGRKRHFQRTIGDGSDRRTWVTATLTTWKIRQYWLRAPLSNYRDVWFGVELWKI